MSISKEHRIEFDAELVSQLAKEELGIITEGVTYDEKEKCMYP